MWDTSNVYTDPENGVSVEKQHRKRNGRGNQTRYLVRIAQDRFVYLSRSQMFDLIDTLDDLCDLISDGKF